MNKPKLVLNGGWGGLTAADALKGMLSADFRIAVIDKLQSFIFYPSSTIEIFENKNQYPGHSYHRPDDSSF